MSQKAFQHREHLSERVIFKMTPGFKRRLYEQAAMSERTVSELTREALETIMGRAA